VISRFFIDRPIFATVLSIVITLVGSISLFYLPVAQYPRITPPGVSISISYPGASAQEVADSVAAPIEQQVNGVEGMLYMSSQSGNDGSYSLSVTFDIGTDVNAALVMVQNRIALAMPQLPASVQNQGITVRKRTPDMLMIVNFFSPDGRYDDKYLSNYATIYAKDELLRVDGISDINIQGQRDYSMRIWADPQKLAAKSITALDLANAVRTQNTDAPAGRIGQPPVSGGPAFQYPLDTVGRLTDTGQFGNIVVKVGGTPPIITPDGISKEPSLGPGGNTGLSMSGASSSSSSSSGVMAGSDPSAYANGGTDLAATQDPGTSAATLPSSVSTGSIAPGVPTSSTSSTGAAGTAGTTAGGTVGSNGLGGGALGNVQSPASAIVRVSDVARLELGAQNYNTICTFDGKPSVGLGLYQLPGTNALEVADRVRAKMEELKASFPDGIDYAIAYDTSLYVRDSVTDVAWTLIDAIALVALVVVVFLQSWRAAVIPLLAVPVSVLGTFVVMAAVGFSLNNISLFGLVLAIGIVVDDAIVVVENVERWMDRGLNAKQATYKAMEEVTGPIIAVALVLCAVFVPCAFIKGITGQFFKQFAVTIAVSTIISTINSLTFSPAMAALLLKGKHEPVRKNAVTTTFSWILSPLTPFTWAFNKVSELGTELYAWTVGRVMKLALLVLLAYGALLVLTVWLFEESPKGFIPPQDQGRLIVNVQLPDAASLERSHAAVLKVQQIAHETPGVAHCITNSGMSFLLQANSPNFAAMFIVLKSFDVRQKGWYKFTPKAFDELNRENVPESVMDKLKRLKGGEYDSDTLKAELKTLLSETEYEQYHNLVFKHTLQDSALSDVTIMGKLRKRWAAEVDAQVTVFPSSPIPGLGSAGGFKFMVEDRGGLGVRALEQRMEDLVETFKSLPYLADAKTQFRARIPQLFVEIDRTKAISLGVSIDDVNQTLSMLLGSLYVNSYNDFGRHWQVTIQADGKFRIRPEQILLFQVRNNTGQMVPLGALIRIKEQGGPISVQRYNLYTAAPIQGNVLPGVSDGDAIAAINQKADETLPLSMRIEWTELMYLQIKAGNTAIIVFILSVISVFLALSALYESWLLPLAVILVVPLCLLCSVVGVWKVTGRDVNIFVQIGLVVLVGLACKNAILIVEFAKHLHMEGRSCYDATKEASKLRLRPILMTSFAFIFGVLPLVLASGAGAEMRRSLGIAVFSGMLGVTVFGIFLTPVFFYVIQGMSEARLFQSVRLRTLLSYTFDASLGAATGYLLARLDVVRMPWGPIVGACAGLLFTYALQEFRSMRRIDRAPSSREQAKGESKP
jgi:multidrug efflux pump